MSGEPACARSDGAPLCPRASRRLGSRTKMQKRNQCFENMLTIMLSCVRHQSPSSAFMRCQNIALDVDAREKIAIRTPELANRNRARHRRKPAVGSSRLLTYLLTYVRPTEAVSAGAFRRSMYPR